MRQALNNLVVRAHLDTLHPNALQWPAAFEQKEYDFISKMVFDEYGHNEASMVYIIKELAQLAEIEKHVTGVMSIILSELQAEPASDMNAGYELHNALSCFGAEELQHANMFYRYVRLLGGKDFLYPDNLYSQRVGLYQGSDSPWIKLGAMCCSAYVGESIITVFENRCKYLDPQQEFFITQLLVAHGLDEARHIEIDHFVFDHVIPRLTDAERRRMLQIVEATEALNMELSQRFGLYAKGLYGVDYTQGNLANDIQIQLAGIFREHVFGGPVIRKVDEALSEDVARIVRNFSQCDYIHPQVKPVATLAEAVGA